jgi:hypothetical protein
MNVAGALTRLRGLMSGGATSSAQQGGVNQWENQYAKGLVLDAADARGDGDAPLSGMSGTSVVTSRKRPVRTPVTPASARRSPARRTSPPRRRRSTSRTRAASARRTSPPRRRRSTSRTRAAPARRRRRSPARRKSPARGRRLRLRAEDECANGDCPPGKTCRKAVMVTRKGTTFRRKASCMVKPTGRPPKSGRRKSPARRRSPARRSSSRKRKTTTRRRKSPARRRSPARSKVKSCRTDGQCPRGKVCRNIKDRTLASGKKVPVVDHCMKKPTGRPPKRGRRRSKSPARRRRKSPVRRRSPRRSRSPRKKRKVSAWNRAVSSWMKQNPGASLAEAAKALKGQY